MTDRDRIAEIIRNARMNADPLSQVGYAEADALLANGVIVPIRCKDCIHAVELDKHCDISRTAYRHCTLLRGDETKYVWHKYKKYYKDYSIVEPNDFCSYGIKRGEDK